MAPAAVAPPPVAVVAPPPPAAPPRPAPAGDAGRDFGSSQAGDGGGGLGDRPERSGANRRRRRSRHPARGDGARPPGRERAPRGVDVCQVRRGRQRQELRRGGQRLPADPRRQRLQAARPAPLRRGAHAPGGRAHDGSRKRPRRGPLRRGPPGGAGGHPAGTAQPADPRSLAPLPGPSRTGRDVVSVGPSAASRGIAGRRTRGVAPKDGAHPERAIACRDGRRRAGGRRVPDEAGARSLVAPAVRGGDGSLRVGRSGPSRAGPTPTRFWPSAPVR